MNWYAAELGKKRMKALIDMYMTQPMPSDKLPHSPQFETFFQQFKANIAPWVKNIRYVWMALMTTRKRDELPEGHDDYVDPPEDVVDVFQLRTDGVLYLNQLYKANRCQRDHLPYSFPLNQMVETLLAHPEARVNPQWPKGHRRTWLTYVELGKKGLLWRTQDWKAKNQLLPSGKIVPCI